MCLSSADRMENENVKHRFPGMENVSPSNEEEGLWKGLNIKAYHIVTEAHSFVKLSMDKTMVGMLFNNDKEVYRYTQIIHNKD